PPSVHDLHVALHPAPQGHRVQERAQGVGGAPALADDLAAVALRHLEVQVDDAALGALAHVHASGLVHERPRELLQQGLQATPSRSPPSAASSACCGPCPRAAPPCRSSTAPARCRSSPRPGCAAGRSVPAPPRSARPARRGNRPPPPGSTASSWSPSVST